MFSAFPGGWPGIGLLLLRTAVGATALAHGFLSISGRGEPTMGSWTCGLLAMVSGASLLVGFLTPLAGVILALGCTATALGWVAPAEPGILSVGLSTLFMAIMAVAIACLGPGARSLDARLFGRREIVIPSPPRVRS